MLSRLLTIREQLVLAGLAVSIAVGSATVFCYHRAAPAPGAVKLPDTAGTPPAPPIPQPPATHTTEPLPPPPTPMPVDTPKTNTPPKNPPEERMGVGIIGAVNQPGLYYFAPGGRVTHLIRAAGGLAPGADLNDINQAAHLIDGTTLAIPFQRNLRRERPHTLRPQTDPANYNPAPYTLSRVYIPAPADTYAASVAETLPTATNSGGPIDLNTATQDALETLPGIGAVLAARIIEFRQYSPFSSVEDLRQVDGIGEKRLDAIRPFVTVSGNSNTPQ